MRAGSHGNIIVGGGTLSRTVSLLKWKIATYETLPCHRCIER
jgi:hypothetical protein